MKRTRYNQLIHKFSPFRAHKTKDKREIDRRTIEYHPEMPEDFSDGLKDLLNGLLNKKPAERLGHNGAKDIMVRHEREFYVLKFID